MAEDTCPECGAPLGAPGTCRARFEELLALDHSRQELWGSRHGLVFGAYALQHPAEFPREVVERAWLALYRIYVTGDEPSRVFAALRAHSPASPGEWNVPGLPRSPAPRARAQQTIADLEPKEVAGYAARVDGWCRAALRAWGAELPAE